MNKTIFKALVVEETTNGFVKTIKDRVVGDLPEADVLIRVHYSSLNYKDALSASGNKGITKMYPHTPGIDAAGVIEHSDNERFAVGDKVIVTSYDLGMNTPGGYGQYIRIPAEWVVPLPTDMSMQEAMAFGTAGFTAAQMVDKLLHILPQSQGKVLVSGATGGVGSMAIALLNKIGFEVVALTGKIQSVDYLKSLGAQEVLDRKDFMALENRPMLKGMYEAGIDTLGGVVLENMVKSIKPYGAVSCCGNAVSPKIELSVFPFILRGVSLLGVSSQNYPMAKRLALWQKLADEWKPDHLKAMYTVISLLDLSSRIDQMLQAKIQGRFVVDMR